MDEENKIDPSEYTLREFLKEITRIIETNPDKVNATIDGIASMYDDGNENHCIIGEFLSQNGLLAQNNFSFYCSFCLFVFLAVPPAGLEPATIGLKVRCSTN